MARLPQPGADGGTWGGILNDFLAVEHNADGTLKAGGSLGTKYTLPGSGIPESDLASAVQTKLNTVGSGVADGEVTDVKVSASAAIAKSKLAPLAIVDADVSAISQSKVTGLTTSLSGKANTSHTHVVANLSDSTVTGRAVLVATDAADARTAIGAGTSSLVIGTTGSDAKAGNYAPDKIDVGLSNVDNTSDANKPVSTATQTALNLKADASSLAVVATTGSYNDLNDLPTPGGTNTGDQTLSLSGVDLTISGANGNTIVLPSGGGSASWGTISGTVSDQTDLQTALDGKSGTAHTHTATGISDSTATGRAVLTAASAAAARTAIGAGTSDLVIGTTGSTAKAGNYAPTKTDVGLSNVDNTSDANKPVSSATQTALNAKANTSHTHVVADTTGLQAALDAKADASATATALNGKSDTSHTHTIPDVANLATTLEGVVKKPTNWAASTAYVVGDYFIRQSNIYRVLNNFTSGTVGPDYGDAEPLTPGANFEIWASPNPAPTGIVRRASDGTATVTRMYASISEPVSAGELTTKQYVDNEIATVTMAARPSVPAVVIWQSPDWKYKGATITARPGDLQTGDIVWFVGNPGGSLPAWAAVNDVWTQG